MGKIKDFPPHETPRAKALRYGINTLSDVELLALILGAGYKGKNIAEICGELLYQNNGLENLSHLTYKELCSYKGIKEAKGLLLSSVFEINKRIINCSISHSEKSVDLDDIYTKYKNIVSGANQEHLFIVVINRFNQIIYEESIYKGSANAMPFSIKDILRILLNHKGKGYYLIHNHPSGELTPSINDLKLTELLMKETKKIGIPLLDHIIIGDNGYISLINIIKK